MRSGTLRHTVDIQYRPHVDDGMGTSGGLGDWTDFKADVRAAIWPIKGTEAVRNSREEGQVTHRIRLRYVAGVTADMRVVFGSRIFELVAAPINPDERGRELELLAVERT